jgi:hypothetical protein
VAADQTTALGTLLGVARLVAGSSPARAPMMTAAASITANPRHARGNRDGLREGLAGADRLAAVPVRSIRSAHGPYAFSYQERRYPVPAGDIGQGR